MAGVFDKFFRDGITTALAELAKWLLTWSWPWVLAAMTAFSGYMEGIPWVYVIPLAAFAFAATITGILRFDEWRARRSPQNKIRQISHIVQVDVDHTKNPKLVQHIQLGVDLLNEATFPLSYIFESGDSMVMGEQSPKGKFPHGPITIRPGQIFRSTDERITMPEMQLGRFEGHVNFKMRYGHPGREKFEILINNPVIGAVEERNGQIIAFVQAKLSR